MGKASSRYFFSLFSLMLGPLLFGVLLLFFDLDPERPEVTRTAAVALWMAAWWMTEATPLAVTALLPVVLFPVLGIMDGRSVSPLYINHIIFLFIGGFMVALAMERWGLHRRIALRVLLFFGTRPRSLLFGFMTAAAFLSMWIANTATTMMMVPIVAAVIKKLEDASSADEARNTAKGMLLGVAYGATLGGIATLVGTPPNLVFVQIFESTFPEGPRISFTDWMLYALPVSLLLLVVVWLLLSAFFLKKTPAAIDPMTLRRQHEDLGPITFEEKVVLSVFVALALLWIFRADIRFGVFTLPGWSGIFEDPRYLNDGTVAVGLALLLFLIPSRKEKGGSILNWETAVRLPWNIVILFGGGFALAEGFKESGLSSWIGLQLAAAQNLHPLLIIAAIALVITFLTELTSNTATAQILLPILAGLACSIRINPLLLMIPGTLACSLAFMLPVATPPNAIIFGTGSLKVKDMARTGFLLNLIGVAIVSLATWAVGRWIFQIDLSQFPAWATP